MKRQWMTLFLCLTVFMHSVLPVLAATMEEIEEVGVSANVPQSRLVVKEEEEIYAWRQNEASDTLKKFYQAE